MTARLYLDENLSEELAILLRGRGCDVISAHASGGDRLPDSQQLARATDLGRAIVTCDYPDFIKLAHEWSLADREHCGIVISYDQCPDDALGEFAEAIVRLLAAHTTELLRNSLVALDAFR